MPRSGHTPRRPAPAELAAMTDRQFFRALRQQGPLSRAAVAQRTGISKPTISESAQRLLALGAIAESGEKTSGHLGRSAALYQLNAQRGISLGVALERGSLQALALDFAGHSLWQQQRDLPLVLTQAALDKALHGVLADLQKEVPLPLLAVGLSVADPVNPATGELVSLPDSPFSHGATLIPQQALAALAVPVVLDNDVNWATLAEHAEGEGMSCAHFLCVYLGQGIGAGLFLGGRLQRGQRGLSGELGYASINGTTLLQHVSEQQGTWDEATCGWVAQTIGFAATLTDPEKIIFCGPRLQEGQAIRALLDNDQRQRPSLPSPSLCISTIAEGAALKGAALGAYEQALHMLGLLEPGVDVMQNGFVHWPTPAAG